MCFVNRVARLLDDVGRPVERERLLFGQNVRERAAVDAVLEQVQPEAVYHLASQASVARSLADPLDTILNEDGVAWQGTPGAPAR